MRTALAAALMLGSASFASAQTVIAPPIEPPPSAAAPIEQRAAWCDAYATWLVTLIDAAPPVPADVRGTHQLEVELASCRIDPQQYELETRAEAEEAALIASG